MAKNSITVRVVGMDAVLRSMRGMSRTVSTKAKTAVSAAALVGINYGKQNAPVDFGILRGSIQPLDEALDGLQVTYGSRLNYAAVNDERHPTKAGYLTDSVPIARSDLRRRIIGIAREAKI